MHDTNKALMQEVLEYILDAEHSHYQEWISEGNEPEHHIYHKSRKLMLALETGDMT